MHYTNISLQMEESSNQVTMEGTLQPHDTFRDKRKDGREGCYTTKSLGSSKCFCFLSLALIYILIRNKTVTQRSLGTAEQGCIRNNGSVLAVSRASLPFYTPLLGVPVPREKELCAGRAPIMTGSLLH